MNDDESTSPETTDTAVDNWRELSIEERLAKAWELTVEEFAREGIAEEDIRLDRSVVQIYRRGRGYPPTAPEPETTVTKSLRGVLAGSGLSEEVYRKGLEERYG